MQCDSWEGKLPCLVGSSCVMEDRAINALNRLDHPNLGPLSRTIKQKLRNLINLDDAVSIQAANAILRAPSPVLLARVEDYAQSLEEGAAAGIFLPLFFAIKHQQSWSSFHASYLLAASHTRLSCYF